MIISTTEYLKAKSIFQQIEDTLQWVAVHPTMTDADKQENTRDLQDTLELVRRDMAEWESRTTRGLDPVGRRSIDVIIYLDNHENLVRINDIFRDENGPFAVEKRCYTNVSRSSLERVCRALEQIELSPNGDTNQLIVGSAEQLRAYLNVDIS